MGNHTIKSMIAVALLTASGFTQAAALLGPTPYLSSSDSPFSAGSFSYFHLEDFEDHLLTVPGVTASAGGVTSVVFGPSIHDSVDADDGFIDGSGLDGDSFFSGNGNAGITFTFDAVELGSLPTNVGIVWTDGAGTTTFEAFDSSGTSLGSITAMVATAGHNGQTDEDSFFGVINSAGVSSIFISNFSGGIEVDHLQYGLNAVPVPAAFWLFGSGLLGLVGVARRKPRI
jgi:hypothetical protein